MKSFHGVNLKQKQGYCEALEFRDVGIFLAKMPVSIDVLPHTDPASALVQRGTPGIRWSKAVFLLALLAFCVALTNPAWGQVHQSADLGGFDLSAGGSFSAYYVGYGQRTLLGPSAFVDLAVQLARRTPVHGELAGGVEFDLPRRGVHAEGRPHARDRGSAS